jgi:hypothetical protein
MLKCFVIYPGIVCYTAHNMFYHNALCVDDVTYSRTYVILLRARACIFAVLRK